MEEEEDDLLTVSEVARRLRVDGATIRRWIVAGSLSAVTLPNGHKKKKIYRIKRSVVENIITEAK